MNNPVGVSPSISPANHLTQSLSSPPPAAIYSRPGGHMPPGYHDDGPARQNLTYGRAIATAPALSLCRSLRGLQLASQLNYNHFT